MGNSPVLGDGGIYEVVNCQPEKGSIVAQESNPVVRRHKR